MLITKLKNNQSGAASLEFIVVFIPWFIIVLLFLNLLFLLGSLMNNQATLVRATQQVAAAGCMPDGLEAQITNGGASSGLIGTRNPILRARSIGSWAGDGTEFAPDGSINVGTDVPSCADDNPDEIRRREFVYLQLEYQQILPILDIVLGVNDGSQTITVRRGALAVSQSLEER